MSSSPCSRFHGRWAGQMIGAASCSDVQFLACSYSVGNKAKPDHEPSGARISGPSLAARKLYPVISYAASYILPSRRGLIHAIIQLALFARPLSTLAGIEARNRCLHRASPDALFQYPVGSPALFLPLALGPLSPMMRTECSSVSNALRNFSY